MEGLIKGMINVALGGDGDEDNGERRQHQRHHLQSQSLQSHDEVDQQPRSSTWAQVSKIPMPIDH